jgi:D-alanyl-D-alanine carboxypeptidase
MKRRSLLTLLGSLYIVGIAAFGYWTGSLWISSKPVATVVAETTEGGTVLGASTTETATPAPTLVPTPNPYPFLLPEAKRQVINSRRYVLYHSETGKVLLEKDSELAVPVASTTKLVTAYVIDDIGKLDEIIMVSREAASQKGSTMGLRAGEKLTTEALLYGLMLNSGNDAALALAEYYGAKLLGQDDASPEAATTRFVEEMNSYASKLNLTSSNFKDPAGLSDEGRSSALDLAKLSVAVNQRETLRKITTTAQITVTGNTARDRHDLRNSNRLVADYFYEGVISGKTGYTEGAGHCLVSSATRNGSTLVAVVLSTYQQSKDASAQEVKKLLDWGFSSFRFE